MGCCAASKALFGMQARYNAHVLAAEVAQQAMVVIMKCPKSSQ